RSSLYILLPMSVVLALLLASQGVVATLSPYKTATLLEPTSYNEPVTDANGKPVLDAQGHQRTKLVKATEQLIAVGPAASQIATKHLGTNGGRFFNTNSSHPFENPTPFSNFLELISILVLQAAVCYTFGKMVGDTRQGWAILAAMALMFLPLLAMTEAFEQAGNPLIARLAVDQRAGPLQSGGNMEGKEVRFGIPDSALWATSTTATSNGS